MERSASALVTEADLEILASARTIVAARYRANWHQVGAALRTATGAIYAAVHLEANVGRIAVCAEAIALGMAVADGDGTIETIVAVDASGRIIAPCGMCREMISDYAPTARVLLFVDDRTSVAPISKLLPYRPATY